jgi:hypothetical protein
MNMIRPQSRALLFSFLCTTISTLSGMSNDDTAASKALLKIVGDYSQKRINLGAEQSLPMNDRLDFARQIVQYKKETFIDVGTGGFDTVSKELTLLNNDIDSEIKAATQKITRRPLYFWGSAATIFGLSLFTWRNNFFAPRIIATAAAFYGLAFSAGKLFNQYAKQNKLIQLKTNINSWLNTASPFQITEIESTGL